MTSEYIAVRDVLESGQLCSGPKVEEFEKVVAEYSQAKYAVATSSGTTALHLGLLASGISKGDRVIVPSFTFPATANAVVHCGAEPVFCDVIRETYNVNPFGVTFVDDMAPHMMPVDQFGFPCEVSGTVRDAACALGSVFHDNEKFGSTVYSFHPRKIITTGEGGMLVTDSYQVASEARGWRNHGHWDSLRSWDAGGFNYRMTDIQAAIGIEQMKRLPEILRRRQKIAALYDQKLSRKLKRPPCSTEQNYQSYVCTYAGDRDKLIKDLAERGVETQVGSYATHRIFGLDDKDFPNSSYLADHSIALPIFPELTQEEQDYVIEMLKEVLS